MLTYFAVLFFAGLLLWVLVRLANRPPTAKSFRDEMRRRYRGDD